MSDTKFQAWFRGQRSTLDAKHRGSLATHRGAVWIHAASVGEFEQARPLIERMKGEWRGTSGERTRGERTRGECKIVVTFFSPSGYELRKDYPLADGVYYLPLPTRWNARKFLDTLQPSMAIFVKYEFWPAYLRELKKRAIPTYSISAIFRPSQRFFHWYGRGQLALLKCFTHIFVQDEASLALLRAHGIEACSVAGDTRFDRVMSGRVKGETPTPTLPSREGEEASGEWTNGDERLAPIAQFTAGCERVIVAGSTWPEDEVLLKQYIANCSLNIGHSPTKLILVPHEVDEAHLHFIFNLFEGRFIRYSQAASGERRTPTPVLTSREGEGVSGEWTSGKSNVMVVDTVGLLSSIYRFGHVAYIGGGFGAGIHNTIEAAAYGMPVIFGPNYHHFREAQGLIDAGAAQSIKTYRELETALDTALLQHEEMGAKAAAYVSSETGATEKILKELTINN